jgi:peptide/nickel transport system ATP-binding protein
MTNSTASLVNVPTTERVLEVRGLSVVFRSRTGVVQALDDVSLDAGHGEIVGIVGESGCGKSTLGMSMMGLLPDAAMVQNGEIRLSGNDLLTLSLAELRRIRGREIGMIFQEPVTSLNPAMPVGRQVAEVLRRHRGTSRRVSLDRAIELLNLVGIPDARGRSNAYPHQLSGGMCQRVAIAIAIACEPQLLIADEPTTALDVTVQAQILELLQRLRDEVGVTIVLITHNLGVIARMADRVVIMYSGRKVEEGKTRDVLDTPRHPYTARLLAATPQASRRDGATARRLAEIPGRVPVLGAPATSCTFAPRCPRVVEVCTARRPELDRVGDSDVACFRPEESW